MVKALGVVVRLLVVGRGEVVVGADDGIAASAAALEPGVALGLVAGGGIADGVNGDVLIAIERRLDLGAVGERLGRVGGGVEALEEGEGRVVEDGILGGGDLELATRKSALDET